MMAKASRTFAVGDRVAYAAAFLKSTGQFTGRAPFARGTVVSVEACKGIPHQFVTIDWDDLPVNGTALSCNLTLVSRIAIDAALAG